MFESVPTKLARLRELDPGLWVFGASTHRHRLAPPVSPAEIERIEARLGIELPDDYRTFVTTIGNGGAGPGHGLERLTERVVDTSGARGSAGLARWLQDDDFVARLRGSFPLEARYDPPVSAGTHDVPGFLPLSDYGCAMYAGLVLNGSHRGEVWFSDPNMEVTAPFGVYAMLHEPHRLGEDVAWPSVERRAFTFEEWYGHWLDRALAAPELSPPPTRT
jgi:hypothetical protein